MTEEDRERIVRLETKVEEVVKDQNGTTAHLSRLSDDMTAVKVGVAEGFATVTQRLITNDKRWGVTNKVLVGVLLLALATVVGSVAKHIGG